MITSAGKLFQKATSIVDRVNDRVTSYRLVIYVLSAIIGWAVIVSFFNKIPYSWHEILVSTAFLLAICWLVNKAVSLFLDIPANKGSEIITALILALILTPPKDAVGFAVLAAAAIAAIVSKYVITFRLSHIFNPAAVGAFFAGEIFNHYPSWWVGTKFLTPLVAIGGILILRKMNRFTMVAAFLATFGLIIIYTSSGGGEIGDLLKLMLLSTQVLFFAVIMLTEPLTSPSKLSRYLPYSILVGVLYTSHKLKLSPEEALLIGGLFTFIFARNRRYKLTFIRKIKEAEGIYSYLFHLPKGFSFTPGQYMEWTVSGNKSDSRGNRRYLTIASSPTEPGVMFTVKVPNPSSTYKHRLNEMQPGDTILASQVTGSFTLPTDSSMKISFLAGGVGVTPFRSMAKYLLDSGQQRDMSLVYYAGSAAQLSYQAVFKKAEQSGLKTSYVTGQRINEQKIQELMPDYSQRRHYISGPYAFVNNVESVLLNLGVSPTEIVTDYFPGYS